MILSVSRRTDVPAYYADWFFGRIEEGYACVRNPFNRHQVSRISLAPEGLDAEKAVLLIDNYEQDAALEERTMRPYEAAVYIM